MRGRVEASTDPFADVDPAPRAVLAALTAEDWVQLASMVDRMNAHTGSFGGWVAPEPIDENSFAMGYSTHGPLIREAYEFAYGHGFVMPGFNWVDWEFGREFNIDRDERVIVNASPEATLGLIMTFIRGDRFSEGALLEAFDDGTMPKLFARLLDFAPSDGHEKRVGSCT